MPVRFAKDEEAERINVLRKQVNDLHVAGKPEIFKPGFSEELRDYVYAIQRDPEKAIAVCERNGVICGFAVLNHMTRPETPYMFVRDFLDIDEFCVDEAYRRTGVATEMIEFIKAYAKEQGIHRIELNMWEFNQGALKFYEAVGFQTYRRYLEMDI